MLDYNLEAGTLSSPSTHIIRHMDELEDVKLGTDCDMKAYRQRFNIEPLVKEDKEQPENNAGEVTRTRATVDETCPKCGNLEMEFYTMQLRSADEGQTVFYECAKCKYKYSQNT
ncbi:hypothetical protein WJX73_001105 [Symbiochloris irregularis]|uniref:DNA-directed RNA polymerase I subunit RPA12 n=1 Tax=Symbiochloris irregularis TaxID=706552 RepID=A0AAW1NYX7_9CHLO